MQTILLVDPETDFLEWAQNQLETPTTRVVTSTTADEAYKIYIAENPDLLISETHLMPFSGLELLARVRQRDSNAIVILMSAFGTTQSVIESMKLGAFDYLRKESLPFNLKPVVDAALTAQAEMRSATAFKPQLTVEQYQDSLVGQSQPMQQVFKMVGRVSHSDAPVMITGESGSGKELVARAIHHYSNRSVQPFIAINCAAIPENLLESELFGHEKGAFTGASAQRIGRFEQSNGGTLFLDEIGDMPLAVQSKILRVLQEGEFSRVGGNCDGQNGRSNHRRHQQDAGARGGQEAISRGSLLSFERGQDPLAAAPPEERGCEPAGRIFPEKDCHPKAPAPAQALGGRGQTDGGISVARQCARTGEHDPAGLCPCHQ